MSVVAIFTLRPSDIVAFDDNYNVWSAAWGFDNRGTNPVKVDPSTQSVIVPVNGLYRLTCNLTGQVSSSGLAAAYVNIPPTQLKAQGHDPSYPFPFYFYTRGVVNPGIFTLPFCGPLGAGPDAPFSIYYTKNYNPDGHLLLELVPDA